MVAALAHRADHRVAIHDIQPDTPDQNAYIERFNRSYRTEVLNAHLFESIAERQALTITWLRLYNDERPHDSLGRVPPLTFLPRPTPRRRVYFSAVYLTEKLTYAQSVVLRRDRDTMGGFDRVFVNLHSALQGSSKG